MSNIQIFNFQSNQVRIEIINNKEYFCAKDVCNILEINNTKQALSRLEKDDVILNDITDSLGRKQKTSFINESGLYELIFSSRKTEAKQFKKWVFNEILPQIRKTGKFEIQPPKIDSQFLLQLSQEMAKKEQLIEEQKVTIKTQDNTIDAITNIQDSYSLREATKNLLVQEKQLKSFLQANNWFIYLSDGEKGKKMYPTAYANNHFAIKKTVLNKARQKYYHQFRITKHGMEYLIKRRDLILKINI
jgi:prophage antirepressor-like protein